MADDASTPAVPAPPKRRRFGLFLAFAAVAVVGVGAFLWWRSQNGVSTDDAFLRADLVQVPAEVGGRVVEVLVKENQHVKAGDLLLRIDAGDYTLKVAQAEANLAAAVADAKRAEEAALVTRSDIRSGEVRLADADREKRLQQELASGGASVQATVDRASTALSVAEQAVRTARASLDAALASVDAAKARVPAAGAALDLAKRDLALTEVHAPADGVASKVDLQPGELVQRGQPVLAIVPDERFVVANFKETDLSRIHVGDPVRVVVDAFPDLDLTGEVQSVGAGTGAIFSLLPADNASGNFVKVVQRVPVRITVGQVEQALPAGLSATVTVGGARP